MAKLMQTGMPIIGATFLVLAFVNFMIGESWVVWVILGFLFGGFGIFSAKPRNSGDGA